MPRDSRAAQFSVAAKLVKEEGVGSLYKGLSAGLLRQATYTTARLGIYQYISDALSVRHEGKVRGQASELKCNEGFGSALDSRDIHLSGVLLAWRRDVPSSFGH